MSGRCWGGGGGVGVVLCDTSVTGEEGRNVVGSGQDSVVFSMLG